MSYIALYRSYRPHNFDEVIGQKHIIKTLKNAVNENKISHAYIFSGPRGIGKTTIARILAKAVNCLHPIDGSPCNECESCKLIQQEATTDIIEQDAASNNGVEEIRQMLEKVNFLPSSLNKKVYIIDEAHMLTTSAFNALLKTLEEPPQHVMFILATTEPYKIPATILSRCQKFDFLGLTVNEISKRIKQISEYENIVIDDEAINEIATSAEGGMRDALGILDQTRVCGNDHITVDVVNETTGKVSLDKILSLVTYISSKEADNVLKLLDSFIEEGKEVNRIVESLIEVFRDVLLFKNGSTENTYSYIFSNKVFIDLSNKIKDKELFYYIDILVDANNKIRNTTYPKIYLEIALLKMINLVSNEVELVERIENLEKAKPAVKGVDVEYIDKLEILENRIKRFTIEISQLDIPLLKDNFNNSINLLKEEIDLLKKESKTDPFDIDEKINELEKTIFLKFEGTNKDNFSNISMELLSLSEKLTAMEEQVNQLSSKISNLENLERDVCQNADCIEKPAIDSACQKELMSDLEKMDDLRLGERITELENSFSSYINDSSSTFMANDTSVFDSRILSLENKIVDLSDLVSKISNQEFITKASYDEYNDSTEKLLHKIKREMDALLQQPSNPSDDKINDLSAALDGLKEYAVNLSLKINELSTSNPVIADQEIITESKTLPESKETLKSDDKEVKKSSSTVIIRKDKNQEEIINEVYDVRIIEKILHESRTKECRSDRALLLDRWRSIATSSSSVLSPYARLLSSGTIVANGFDYLLVIFGNASICNYLMTPANYQNCLLVLKSVYGREISFMALPEKTWKEKRQEYAGQFSFGILYPKLKPIDDKELMINFNNNKLSGEKDSLLKKAEMLFGKNIVEIEED